MRCVARSAKRATYDTCWVSSSRCSQKMQLKLMKERKTLKKRFGKRPGAASGQRLQDGPARNART
jgi:hypothetical protein